MTYNFRLVDVHSENRHTSLGFANTIEALKAKLPSDLKWEPNAVGGVTARTLYHTYVIRKP